MQRSALSSLLTVVPLPSLILVIATSFSSSPAEAQMYIFGRADIPIGSTPMAVASGDFNGDGLPDLAIANSGDATVSILLKRLDGSYAPEVTLATGPQPIAIATGDFNRDGNLDIVVTSENCTPIKYGVQCVPSTVSILFGNGDGTFQPHMDYSVGQLPSSLVVADFNGDGNLDLAVANAYDSTVSILLGNGDGTFRAQVVYPTATSGLWGSVVVGDFNGDGKFDLAVSCGSAVSVLLGNGDGTFQAHLDSGTGGASLAVGDFNRDGKLDLAVSGVGTWSGVVGAAQIGILTGKGDGTFILTQQYSAGVTVTAADLRGIGMVDLVLTGSGSDRTSAGVAVLLGNGDGTFQAAANYGTGGAPIGAVVTDLNGDGKLDLAVADSACIATSSGGCTGMLSVLLGFGDGTFVGTTYYPASAGSGSVVSADFNNDGKLDFADAYGSVSVLLGNGDGSFQPEISYSTGINAGYLVTADLRNNGIMDLVTANNSANTVSALLGNGDGTFQSPVDYNAGLGPHSVATGDFRGIGKVDVAVADVSSASVAILLGNGDGTFQSPVGYITGSYPQSIATGDFNQDGKLDLAVTDNPGVSILLGNGDGTFAGHVDYPGAGASAIATGDFNDDGKLDLATGGEGGISILLGNGDGTFQSPVNYPAGFGATFSIVVTDFNQDGKPDLAVSTESNQDLILLGNGDGTFQPAIPYLFIYGSLTVGDFNGDGAPDWAGGDANAVAYRMGIMVSAAFKSVTPGSLNFGSQGVGTTSTAQTITISNPTNVKINVSSIGASGNFSETNDCGAELAVSTDCTVNVTFSPNATGAQSGAITLTDSTRISPLAIPLSGSGVNGSFLTPYPSRVPFPAEPVGVSSSKMVVTLVNTGNASLNISSVGVGGPDASDFTQTNTCPGSLNAGASCTVSLTFTPTDGGTRSADLTISDTASGSPQVVPLVGAGFAPAVSLSPSGLTFASQNINTTSQGQTVTLTNSGSASLTVSRIAASGDFAETNSCNSPLAPGNNCKITITFTPTAQGNRSGSVTTTDNAANNPQTIALSGIGAVAPGFSMTSSSGSSTCQTISAGQTANFSVDFTSVAGWDGTVNLSCGVTPAVTPAPTCTLSSSSVQIGATGTQTVTIQVGTTAAVTSGASWHRGIPAIWPPLGVLLLLGSSGLLFGSGRKRPLVSVLPAIVFAALSMSCGGSSSVSTHTSPGTPAGSYTATIAGTAVGNSTQTMPLQVIVQ